MEINKEDFDVYEKVRKSGITNMWDVTKVVALTDNQLTKEKCMKIMKEYSKLKKRFSD